MGEEDPIIALRVILESNKYPTHISSKKIRVMNQTWRDIIVKDCKFLKKLKVSKSQNKFMKSSFLPKYEQNILRISALASKERSNQKNKGTLLY